MSVHRFELGSGPVIDVLHQSGLAARCTAEGQAEGGDTFTYLKSETISEICHVAVRTGALPIYRGTHARRCLR